MNVIRLVLLFAIFYCANGSAFSQRPSAVIVMNSVTHATCFGDNGSVSVQLNGGGPAGAVIGGYTLVLNKDGAYYNTITSTVLQSSLSITHIINNLPPGIYTVSGSITITNPTDMSTYGTPGFLSLNFYLGYQALWAETKEMAPQSVSSTVLQNVTSPTQSYAGARLLNNDVGDSWHTITPFFNSGNATYRSVFVPLFFSGALGAFNPASAIDYLEFRKAGSDPSIGDGIYYKTATGVYKLNGVTYTSKIRLRKSGSSITVYADGGTFPLTFGSGSQNFSATNNANIQLSVHTKVLNDGVNVGSSYKCNTSSDVYATLFHELDGYYYTMKNGKLRFVFDQNYDTQTNLKFNIYNNSGMLVKTQANFPAVQVTYGENYLTLDLTTSSACIGKNIFILEVISDKKEKMFLRFYNEYNSCTPEGETPPGGIEG